MSKNKIVYILLPLIVLAVYEVIDYIALAPKSKITSGRNAQNSNLVELHATNKDTSNSQQQREIANNENYLLHGGLKLPFIEASTSFNINHGNNSLNAEYNDKNLERNLFNNTIEIVEHKNLNTQKFQCPESHPYALDYKLVELVESIINGRGYRNACAFNSIQPFGDLLYGNEQSFNGSGKYENLTAYLPWKSSDTCQEDGFLIPLMKSSDLESINAIRDVSSNEVIGYQIESVNLQNKDKRCLNFCQNLCDTYCAKLPEDSYYCKNTVSRAYYRDSIYKRLNLSEKFCVCEFEGRVSHSEVFHFNQVVDLESVIDYSVKLEQVSCTNSLMLLNNQ